jgi:uncharacterized protein YaiL (DUF2058 family)
MNSSLRDQLLAAGLVTEKQARQAAQQEQQRQFRNRPRPNDSVPGGQRGGNSGTQPGRNQSQGQGPRDGRGMPGAQGTNQGQNSPQGRGTNQGQGATGGQGAGQNSGNGPSSRAAHAAGGLPPQAAASLQAQQAQAAKVARDLELNRRREEKAQRKARLAQIEQIIEQNRLPRLETEDHYSFIDGKKVRRMSVDPQRREQLTRGDLAIVRYRGHYAVVTAPIAERIRERDPNMIVPLVQPKESAEQQDDAYKDFVVPDDLMW